MQTAAGGPPQCDFEATGITETPSRVLAKCDVLGHQRALVLIGDTGLRKTRPAVSIARGPVPAMAVAHGSSTRSTR